MQMVVCFVLGLGALFSSYGLVETARILCASQQFPSHMAIVHTTVENLLKNGHEVYTIFSDIMPVPSKLEKQGIKIIKYHTPKGSHVLSDPMQEARTLEEIFNETSQDHSRESLLGYGECVDMDNDKTLEKQLLYLNFDLAVVDDFGLTHCMMFLPLKLKIPFVLVSAFLEHEMVRVPLLPSYSPLPILRYSDDMTFIERLVNTLSSVLISSPPLTPFIAVRNTTLIEKYNTDPSVTTWHSLGRKAQLLLVTRGGILEYPVPLPPHVINIECLTCKRGKHLAPDIQQLADASEGIIVVSFGSLITRFPDGTARKFLEVFSRRKELVFWRYKGELPGGDLPGNVKIMKWLPQNDLLAHPKTKLFITHAGNNGQYESVYHGVPMLAFPLFAEQHHNSHRITVHGYGLESDILKFKPRELNEKIDRIINEPHFRAKTQKMSRVLKKAPMDARELAAYWVEHVLEFGSDHLKSHALQMPWFSFYMVDIMLFLEFIAIAFVIVFISTCVFLYKKCFVFMKAEKKEKDKTL